jgi:hypothetical protein
VLQTTVTKPTIKLRLAAIRKLFDWLSIGQVPQLIQRTRCAGPSTSCAAARRRCPPRNRARRLVESLDTSTSACAIAR